MWHLEVWLPLAASQALSLVASPARREGLWSFRLCSVWTTFRSLSTFRSLVYLVVGQCMWWRGVELVPGSPSGRGIVYDEFV